MFRKLLVIVFLFPTLTWAAPAPETVLTGSCLTTYLGTYKKSKNNKVFIYAREADTGKSRCSWQIRNDDLKAAKKKALSSCAKHNLNAECFFIDINDEYLVKDGDFTLVTQPNKTKITDKEKQALMSEAEILLQGNCLSFYGKFLKQKEHRMFSYSMDANGNHACGYSYGNVLEPLIERSIKQCENNKRKRGKKGPKSDCKIYAENRKILLKPSDYGLEISAKSDKQLDESELESYLKQAEKTINKGPCLFQFKYYLSASQHQAFYLASDKEGKQACAWVEGAFSPEIANKQALETCKQNVKKKGIKAACELYAQNFNIIANEKEVPEAIIKTEQKIEIEPVKEVKPKIEEKIIDKEADFKKAIFKGNLTKIKKYITEGADINNISKDGISPIFIAAAKADEEYFYELIDKGANIKQAANNGGSLLFAAVAGGNLKIVNDLLDKGFDINEQSVGNNTPLHLAFIRENLNLVKLLMKAGADASIKNTKGKSGYDIAKEFNLNLDEIKN